MYRAVDRLVGGLRASPSEETIGLDVAGHMALAYPYFVQTEMIPITHSGGEERRRQDRRETNPTLRVG